MNNTYVAPTYQSNGFNCQICHTYAHQIWGEISFVYESKLSSVPSIYASFCSKCKRHTIWKRFNEDGKTSGKIVYPIASLAPLPHDDMPENIKKIYDEAAQIFSPSPRAASALLRYALELICKEQGDSDKSLNDNIGLLVQTKGLNIQIQQALDAVRVIGNNALHPLEIDFDEIDSSIPFALFELINLIVDDLISKPKRIAELYSHLPEKAVKAIEKRDKINL